MLKLRHHVKSHLCVFRGLLEAYFKIKKNSREQEKESNILVRVGYKSLSLVITVCHHSASLVMPKGDPRDGFFYLTLSLMMDSYSTVLRSGECMSEDD